MLEETDETMDESSTSDVSNDEDVVGETGKENVTSGDETFFDPKELPEELQPEYKRMQAAFTKKTQAVADVRKKAEAFDNLIKDEKFRKWATNAMEPDNETENPEENMSEQDKKLSRIEKTIHDMEIEKIASKHPDFDNYLDDVEKYVKKGLTFEEAYILAKSPFVEEEVKKKLEGEEKKKLEAKKRANIEAGTSVLPSSNKTPKTFKEAFAMAQKDLGV